MNFSLAIFVCLAAYAVAAPSISSSVQQLIISQAIEKLEAQLANTTNPALQILLQQAIDKIKNMITVQRIVSEVDMQRGFWDTMSGVFGLDGVWTTITNFHGSIKQKFFQLLTQVMFHGGNAITAAKEILKGMAAELLAHGNNAGPIFQNTVDQLQAMLINLAGSALVGGRSNERGIWDTLGGIFGISDIMPSIVSVHSDISEKFKNLLQQIIFSGKNVWAKAFVVIQQLHKNILAHLDQIPQYLAAAVEELSAIVKDHFAGNSRMIDEQRGFWDIVSSTLGLGNVWSIITGIHGAAKDKFMSLLTQIMLGGSTMWSQAKPILANMASELVSHATNGKPILQDTVDKLQALLFEHASNIVG